MTILRTGAGSPVAPFVIQALRDAGGVRVVAADMDPRSIGFHYADAAVTIPAGGSPELVPELLDICERENVDVLFPDVEEELLAVAEAKSSFERAGVRVLLSDADAIRIALDKYLLAERLQELAVPAPRTFSPEDFETVAFPAFIKPRRGRGSTHAHRVDGRAELDYFLPRIPDPIVQEHVAGVEYTVDGLLSLEGEFLYAAVRERLATDSGISVKGRTTVSPEIEGYVKTMAEGLGLIGPVCIQCIVDGDGTPRFFDCNPRLGGGTVLSIQAGAPIIEDIIRLVRDEPIEGKVHYRSGLVMLRRWAEVYVDPLEAGQAVIFDLDFTLYDADTFNIGALRGVAEMIGRKHNRDPVPLESSLLRLRAELGADHSNLFDEWLQAHEMWSKDDVKSCIDSLHSYTPPHGLELYPGVREMLADLRQRGLKIGVVTDGHEAMQKTKLQALGIDGLVDTFVLNASLGAPKPDPKGLTEALRRLGVEAAAAVYVGDHPVFDILMAQRAGVRSVRVLTGAFAGRPHAAGAVPDVVLEDICQLAGRLSS